MKSLFFLKICLLLAVYGSLFTACDFTKRIDTRAAVKELHEREVKRITPAQFTAQVDEWGHSIVDSLNKNLVQNLENTARDSVLS